eukprot:g13476.t1
MSLELLTNSGAIGCEIQETLGLQKALLHHSRYTTPALILFLLVLLVSMVSFVVDKIFAAPSLQPGEDGLPPAVCNRFAAFMAIIFGLVCFATSAEVLTYDYKGWCCCLVFFAGLKTTELGVAGGCSDVGRRGQMNP